MVVVLSILALPLAAAAQVGSYSETVGDRGCVNWLGGDAADCRIDDTGLDSVTSGGGEWGVGIYSGGSCRGASIDDTGDVRAECPSGGCFLVKLLCDGDAMALA